MAVATWKTNTSDEMAVYKEKKLRSALNVENLSFDLPLNGISIIVYLG